MTSLSTKILKTLQLRKISKTAEAIIDKHYNVINGTIRAVPEHDDAWLFALGANHKKIFDVGSNIGQAAMLFLYHPTVEKIVLVDPNPIALSQAAENLIFNNLAYKAVFMTAFASQTDGETVDFYTVDSGAAGSIYKGFAKSASKANASSKVETFTLDTISAITGIHPDLVKLDIEGAEKEALKGCNGIAKKGTTFFVEVHSGPELTINDNTQAILDWCSENDYCAWYMKDKEILTIDKIKERGRYHTLLLPSTVDFPVYLKNIEQGARLTI